MIRKSTFAFALGFSLIAGCASMLAPAPAQVTDGILTGKNGMTQSRTLRRGEVDVKGIASGRCRVKVSGPQVT